MSLHHTNKQLDVALPLVGKADTLACLRRGGYQFSRESGRPTSIRSSWTLGNPEDST